LTAPERTRSSLTSRLSREVSSARSDQNEAVGLERLLDEVIGAQLDRRNRGFDVAMTRDHDDGHSRMLLLDDLQQLQSVKARALQPYVEQHQLRAARFYRRERLVGIARDAGAVTLVGQDSRNDLTDVVLVVDDQNVGGHC
jgi:hypothetical protein